MRRFKEQPQVVLAPQTGVQFEQDIDEWIRLRAAKSRIHLYRIVNVVLRKGIETIEREEKRNTGRMATNERPPAATGG